MTGSLSRAAPTFNSMFFKPMMRKSYHKKGCGGDRIQSETAKTSAEEALKKSTVGSENDGNSCWVPHDRTGIYYPKGHEKAMEDVPAGAAKHIQNVNWFSNHFDDA